MKYLVLIGDGMSDLPLAKLKGKTPLEVARTPNMDFLAKNGTCGWVSNVPKGLPPASDVATMSIFGYSPNKYYTGRGPLEAASLGVKLAKDEIAMRCNLVTIKNRKMADFTAGHINTAEAKKIMRALDKKLGCREIRFYPGLSYRHLLVIKSCLVSERVETTAPHDITGQMIRQYLPKGKGANTLLQLMNESEVLLHEMKTEATMIWPWSPGKQPNMPAFKSKYGKRAAVITAVHLLKGTGKVLGMEVINVPGATGYLDTNYEGKAKHALKALKKNDIVFVHVEAPDEAGHEGSIPHKIKAIEDFDRYVVGTVLKEIRNKKLEIGILVLPDHPTPIELCTHVDDPVPFLLWGPGFENSGANVFTEEAAKETGVYCEKGYEIIKKLVIDS